MNRIIISKIYSEKLKCWILDETLFEHWFAKLQKAIKLKDKQQILNLYDKLDLKESLLSNSLNNDFQNTIFKANQILFNDQKLLTDIVGQLEPVSYILEAAAKDEWEEHYLLICAIVDPDTYHYPFDWTKTRRELYKKMELPGRLKIAKLLIDTLLPKLKAAGEI